MDHANEETIRNRPQLAVFDIDGTLTEPHNTTIFQEVIDGLRHLHSKGVITTVCTGRPFVRMREALGEHYETIISDNAMIPVEHGAKIVDKYGRVIVESAFDNDDIEKFIEFTGLNLDLVYFLAFNPGDVSRKTQIWCPDPGEIESIREKRGWYADIFEGSLLDVKERLYSQPISNVTIKMHSHIRVENLKLEFTGGSIKSVFQDGQIEYMKSKVNKARAIHYVRKHFGVLEGHILVAGNAINDVDMLNMEAGHRILVGKEGPERDTVTGYLYGHDYIKFLDTPQDLGHYLQSL